MRTTRCLSGAAEISSLLTIPSHFHFHVYLLHCTWLLARGSSSPAPSPLRTTPDCLFEGFLASSDWEPWDWGPRYLERIPTTVTCSMSLGYLFWQLVATSLKKEEAHESTTMCHPLGNLGSASCFQNVDRRFAPPRTNLDYSPFNSPPPIWGQTPRQASPALYLVPDLIVP